MTLRSEADSVHRLAVYFAPAPDSQAWHAGSAWLGRCAADDAPRPQPMIPGMSPEQFASLTADPRRYGWHGTLKAPFRVARGLHLDDVRTALHALCNEHKAFTLSLQVCRLGDFLALVPSHTVLALNALAADCVKQLQPLAAPLNEDELARRRRAGLTPEQDALMRAWGYPYVLTQFRFHLSLTGPLGELAPESQACLIDAATAHFQNAMTCEVDRVSLFIEPAPGAPFRLLDQIHFSA